MAGPQEAAVTGGNVAASVPLLGAPSLADSTAEAIDGGTLSFLLQHASEVKRKEEEAVEAAELAELEAKLARAEERIVQEIDRLEGVSDRSDLTQLLNRCFRWHVAMHETKKRKLKRRKRTRREEEFLGQLLLLILRCGLEAFPVFPQYLPSGRFFTVDSGDVVPHTVPFDGPQGDSGLTK